jgi:hypothetical protein
LSSFLNKLAYGILIFLLLTQWVLASAAGISKVELDGKGRPLWESGIIWLKVKPTVLVDRKQKEVTSFNSPSLDSKIKEYGILGIRRSFHPMERPGRTDLPDLTRIFTLELPANANAKWLVEALNQDSNVEYAERVPAVYQDTIPNDEYYESIMYHLPQIQAEEAWDIHKGEDGVVEVIVGICDSGVDWKHPDLGPNIYNRLGEDADGDGVTMIWDGLEWVLDPDDLNGIDDDNNGYVDDLIGWNMMADPEGNQNNNPMDPPNRGHGSHVAGLAAGVTNNTIGIASISWNVKILGTSHSYTEDGGHYIFRAYSGLVYLADNGADIINASWGGGGYSQAAAEVIRYITGVGAIFVSSAGNEDDGMGGMTGFGPRYPTSYPGCISVASVDRYDSKAWYSSFAWSVDIAAPGGNHAPGLLSTVPYGSGYDYYSGTSMAGPVAAGMFALVKSYHPDWTNAEIIRQVLGTTDNIDANNDYYTNWLGSGRINAFRALNEENVTLVSELKQDLWDVSLNNPAAEDWEMQPGQSTDIGFILRNYSHLIGDSSTTFTLTSSDPHVSITNPSIMDTIFADDFYAVGDFSLIVDEDANTEVAELWLITQPQSAEVITGDSIHFDLLVNSTSLNTTFLDLELSVDAVDTSIITIHNSASTPVNINTEASSVDPNSLLWHVSETNAYEGNSWWCGDPDIGGYPNSTVQYMYLPVIDLSSTSNPELTFMLDWYIEDPGGADAPFDGWDGANVWISTDRGETFEVIQPISPAYTCTALSAWGDYWELGLVPGWAGNNNGFVEAQFNLFAFASDEIIIRFGFAADGGATGLGVFIDNISVHDGTNLLFENDGVFGGGIHVDGFPSETISTPWLEFPNGTNTVPAGGDLDLEIVTNTAGMSPGFYSTTANVMHSGHVLDGIDITLAITNDPVKQDPSNLPQDFSLNQNYPNPFNPSTTLSYALPINVDVSIQVYDITGRLVSNPVSCQQSAGYYSFDWQARDLKGKALGTGLYLARIQAGEFTKVIRMVYLK